MVVWYKRLFYKYIGTNGDFYLWYLFNMIINPKAVYETTRYQFSLTQQWHRRDHSITKIIVLINIVISILYALTFTKPIYFIPYVLFSVGLPLIVGIIISTVLYYIVISTFTTGEIFTVRYSYDIHNNAYLCYMVITRIVVYILSPILFQKGFLITFISNLIQLFGILYYMYITYLGYAILPFIQIPRKAILIPMVGMIVFVAFFTLCGYNIASLLL